MPSWTSPVTAGPVLAVRPGHFHPHDGLLDSEDPSPTRRLMGSLVLVRSPRLCHACAPGWLDRLRHGTLMTVTDNAVHGIDPSHHGSGLPVAIVCRYNHFPQDPELKCGRCSLPRVQSRLSIVEHG
jgi:hypothetical protein